MSKQPLLTTGLNGLVGSKFAEIYQEKYQFDNLDLRDPKHPVDITDKEAVFDAVSNSNADTLIHLAAFTDVDAAWKQSGDEDGPAYQVNVIGTQNIAEACKQFKKNIIHISTAYVFDGKQDKLYTEEIEPNPIEWYGQTKWEAEQIVKNSNLHWTILRIDQPFRPDPFEKKDYAHKIIDSLLKDELYPMFEDHYFSPTYIPDFAKVLDFFVETEKIGLYHATNGERWNDYHFAKTIKEELELPGEVTKGSVIDYLATLDRPYQKNTALDSAKLRKTIDFDFIAIKRGIQKLRYRPIEEDFADQAAQTPEQTADEIQTPIQIEEEDQEQDLGEGPLQPLAQLQNKSPIKSASKKEQEEEAEQETEAPQEEQAIEAEEEPQQDQEPASKLEADDKDRDIDKDVEQATVNKELPFPKKPTEPNKIVGMAVGPDNEIIEQAMVEILDQSAQVVRAVKTNSLGQFFVSSPLSNGTYYIETKKQGYRFQTQKIKLTGKAVEPIEIKAK